MFQVVIKQEEKAAPAKAPAQGKGKNDPGSFVPSQDMSLISDCFTNLENAINTSDEKAKFDLLVKGVEMLNTYQVNYNDENTLELHSELWYKYGIQMFELKKYKNSVIAAINVLVLMIMMILIKSGKEILV